MPETVETVIPIHGYVGGKDWSIGGASVQLYAVGTQGIASAAVPLLSQPVLTEDDGTFSIAGSYTCPAPTSQLYIVASGGYSSTAVRRNNQAIRLMTMLGACNKLSSSLLYTVDEVTTVALTWSFSSYMSSSDRMGYLAGDPSFQAALTKLNQLVDLTTGISPGKGVPSGYAVQTAKLDTLASDLHACINSSGAAGESSPCSQLFSMTTLENEAAPTDTSAAALNLAIQDHLSLDGLYRLIPAEPAFTPVLTEEPADWNLDLLRVPETPQFSPSSGSYAAGQPLVISTKAGAAIRYTVDGSIPTQESPIYSAPLQLSSAETVRAIAVVDGVSSAVGSATFSLQPAHLVFSMQPASTTVGTALSPAPTVRVLDTTGALVTTPVLVTLQLNSSAGTLNGTAAAMTSGGIATFPALSITAASSADTLTASAPHIISATSSPFNVSAAAPKTTLLLSLPSASIAAGNTLNGTIMLSQPAGSGGVAVRLTSGTPSVLALAASTIMIPAGQSQASFAANALNPGSSTLTAAAPGCAGSTALVSIASQPAHLVFSMQPASTTVGTALSPAPTVRVLDTTGALVTTPVLVTLQLNSSAGTLNGTAAAMTSGGIATFPALSITAASSADTLTASAPDVPSTTSSPFNVSATAPALVIPGSAVSAGDLDGSPKWEWNHDPGTSGNSTGTSTYAVVSPSLDNVARGFLMNYSAHGGEIYHLSFANDTNATHFVYDTYIYLADPSQIANIEMDMNQVLSNGQTVILGTQCASGSGTWEYTKVAAGGTHWYASNIPCHPKTWAANAWHHVRIATHRDSNGIATYDGVEVDGVYTLFVNAAGPSALSLGWARGDLLLNFQLDGANAGAGTIQAYLDKLTIYRW